MKILNSSGLRCGIIIFAIFSFFSCEETNSVSLRSPSFPDTSDITFAVVSDPQIAVEDKYSEAREANRLVVEEINALAKGSLKVLWPAGTTCAGETVSPPSAAVMNGDLTNWGLPYQLDAYRRLYDISYPESDIGVKIKLPVFPGLGNHDLCHSDESNAARMLEFMDIKLKESPAVKNIDPYTRNYSWDWGDTHFVQLNLWAGNIDWSMHDNSKIKNPVKCKGHPDIRAKERNRGLQWLKKDLSENAAGGRKVVIFNHTPLNFFDVWDADDYKDTAAALKPYRVVAIFSGHSHRHFSFKAFESSYPGWGYIYNFAGGHAGWDYGFKKRPEELGFIIVRLKKSSIDIGFYNAGKNSSQKSLTFIHSRSW